MRQLNDKIAIVTGAGGGIDVLHNNAADLSPELSNRDHDIEAMEAEVWDRTFAVNLRGTMLCCKYVLPHMVSNGGGSIINTASNLGMQGNLGQAAYAASKAAVIQLSRSITLTPYLGIPEDIANAVAFLASDDARYVTGHNLVVDGGTVAHVPGFAQFGEIMGTH